MTSVSVANPYSLFVDEQGDPLSNAKVYIGVAGADPQQYPQQVFWDEDRTVTASQPLLLTDGVFTRLGSPSQAFVAGAYSIRVLDQQNQLVTFEANVGGFEAAVAQFETATNTALAAKIPTAAIGDTVQAQNANLSALAGLTLAADKLPYATGANALALASLSPFARTFIDDADLATLMATLGLTDVVRATAATITTNGNLALSFKLATVTYAPVLKWGVVALPTSGTNVGTVTVTFPIAFPNACFAVIGVADGGANGSWATLSITATAHSATAVTFVADSTDAGELISSSRNILWLAIGN